MKPILVIDNFDSFTYNLVHLLKELGNCRIDIVRNNAINFDSVSDYSRILLSPGPGLPSEAGAMPELIEKFSAKMPILGVCLGHQALAEYFGAKLANLEQVMHGKASNTTITEPNESLFRGIKSPFLVGRYHSWIVSKDHFPESLTVTARDENGEIMAFSHKELPIAGLQFHPESILTEVGHKIISNWLAS